MSAFFVSAGQDYFSARASSRVGARLTKGVRAKITASLNKVDPDTILAIAVFNSITVPPNNIGKNIKANSTKNTASTGKLIKLDQKVLAQLP